MPTRLYLRSTPPTFTSWVLRNFNQSSYIIVDNSSSIYLSTQYNYGGGGGGNTDLINTKIDSNGNTQWQRSFGATNTNESIRGLDVDSSNNLYFLGDDSAFNNFIGKYNSSGSLQWLIKIVPPTGSTSGYDRCFSYNENSSSIYTLYSMADINDLSYRPTLIKYNVTGSTGSGSIQWQKRIRTPAGTAVSPQNITVSSSGSVWVNLRLDRSISLSTYYSNVIAKYNSSGVLQWQKYISSSIAAPTGSVSLYSMVSDNSENLYLGGYTDTSLTDTYIYLIKLDTNGNTLWQKTYGPFASTNTYGGGGKITLDTSNNIYCLSFSTLDSSLSGIFALDSNGNLKWQRTITSSSLYDIDKISGSIILSGNDYASRGVIWKLPDDGTQTGSYGNFYTYSSAFYTLSSGSLNVATTSFVSAETNSITVTVSSTSYPDVVGTFAASDISSLNYPFGGTTTNITTSIYISGSSGLEAMSTTSGSNQTSLTFNTLAVTTQQNVLLGTFVSPTLDSAQTVGGGNMILNAAENESNLNVNFWVNGLNAYVWRPSTGTKVGIIKESMTSSLGGLEPTAAGSEQVTHITGITTNAVSAQAGDVIICEVWGNYTQGMGTAYTATWYYNGTTTNTTENAIVSNHASFIEFSENLTFGTPVGPSTTKTYFFVLS